MIKIYYLALRGQIDSNYFEHNLYCVSSFRAIEINFQSFQTVQRLQSAEDELRNESFVSRLGDFRFSKRAKFEHNIILQRIENSLSENDV